jgi:hypothetical protein
MVTCIAPHSRIAGAACGKPCEPGKSFCGRHARAPAARRGGWLSAERRRRQDGARLDASAVYTRLWVGGRPPFDRDLPDFDVLILCAEELQPERPAFHGTIFRCPLPDATLDLHQLTSAVLAARSTGDALIRGSRVLVTCGQGLNRSAFVAGMAIARITRMTTDDIITLIRSKRSSRALANPYFRDALRRLVRR